MPCVSAAHIIIMKCHKFKKVPWWDMNGRMFELSVISLSMGHEWSWVQIKSVINLTLEVGHEWSPVPINVISLSAQSSKSVLFLAWLTPDFSKNVVYTFLPI